MDTFSLIVFVTLVLLVSTSIFLSLLFRNLIRKQIDDQMKEMIPVKAFRERIGIKIKLRK
jgi:hypothetical protein